MPTPNATHHQHRLGTLYFRSLTRSAWGFLTCSNDLRIAGRYFSWYKAFSTKSFTFFFSDRCGLELEHFDLRSVYSCIHHITATEYDLSVVTPLELLAMVF